MPTLVGSPVFPNLQIDPTFEGDFMNAEWQSIVGSVVLANNHYGFGGFQREGIISGGAGSPATAVARQQDANATPVTPGHSMSVRLTAYPTWSPTIWMRADWFNAAGALISSAAASAPVTVTGDVDNPTSYAYENLVVPAGAAKMRLAIGSDNWQGGGHSQGINITRLEVFDAATLAIAAGGGGVTVTTEDAAPSVAPHRISSDPAYDDVAITFTPTNDGKLVPSSALIPTSGPMPGWPRLYPGVNTFPKAAQYPSQTIDAPLPSATLFPDQGSLIPGLPRGIVGWSVMQGGVDVGSGRKVVRSPVKRASPARTCGPAALAGYPDENARTPSGVDVAAAFTFADVNDGGGDGTRTENVYVLTEGQGWS